MDVQSPSTEADRHTSTPTESVPSPWLTVMQGATWAQCGPRQLYEAVQRGDLRAVRVTGRNELRFRREWIDAWLEATPAK
jgi:excisionase family DNA binding protein